MMSADDNELKGLPGGASIELRFFAHELTEEMVAPLIGRGMTLSASDPGKVGSVVLKAIQEQRVLAVRNGKDRARLPIQLCVEWALRAAAVQLTTVTSPGQEDPKPLDLVAGLKLLNSGDLDGLSAFIVGLFEELADTEATNWNYGNLIHDANILSGHLLYAQGRTGEAAAALVKAGSTPGSPQLNSFGPDLSLAWVLLKQGQEEAVLSYLKGVSGFWSPPSD